MKQDEFKDWLVGDGINAKCAICLDSIHLGNMGVSALKSHAKSRKHMHGFLVTQKNLSVQEFFSPTTHGKVPSTYEETNNQPNKYAFSNFASTETLKAETIWVMNCVEKHQSYNSNRESNLVFPRMFPHNNIAEGFSCGPNKTSYIVNSCLAPYFSDFWRASIGQNGYVLLFDESLNR